MRPVDWGGTGRELSTEIPRPAPTKQAFGPKPSWAYHVDLVQIPYKTPPPPLTKQALKIFLAEFILVTSSPVMKQYNGVGYVFCLFR